MSKKEKVYWIWMQQIFGAGSSKPRQVLSTFKSVKNFYEAGEREWKLSGIFTQRNLQKMRTYSLEQAEELLYKSEQVGQWVITPSDPDYPELLKHIYNPPCVIYGKGQLPNVDEWPSIAMVGTRNATLSGRKIAFRFACELSKMGAVIISGGARGIDAACHKGALQSGGKTICVLGCGLECRYLMEYASMRRAITENGAVISEVPLNTPPGKSSFPIRNRIISGLSVGVVVIEAAAKSGSLITANFALEQGRDVFAVPCSIDSPVSKGVNGLIKLGAKPVSESIEILEEYLERFPGKIRMNSSEQNSQANFKKESIKESAPEQRILSDVSKAANQVYQALSIEPMHVSILGEKTGLPVTELLVALTELELCGKIQSYSGRRYGLIP